MLAGVAGIFCSRFKILAVQRLRPSPVSRLPAGESSVEVDRALLRSGERGGGGPARLTLLVRKAGSPERRIRLVESLWADEFDPPGFLEVIRWILGPGAWLLFRHVLNMPSRLVRRVMPGASGPPEFWLLILGLPLGVAAFFFLLLPLELIGILLVALRLLPIPYFRAQIEWVGPLVSEVLGDSYLFACNPVVCRALADRVRRDLDALPKDGAPVVILAHSQGAAVAFDMLERHPHPPPLVTYGAGIRKLHELVDATGELGVPGIFYSLWWIAPLWAAALVGAVLDVSRAFHGSYEPDPWAGVSWLLIFVLYLVGGVMAVSALTRDREIDKGLAKRIRKLLKKQPAWLDVFATFESRARRPADHEGRRHHHGAGRLLAHAGNRLARYARVGQRHACVDRNLWQSRVDRRFINCLISTKL